MFFFFSSRRRHTRCALVTGVQTCALPISLEWLALLSSTVHVAFRPIFRPNRLAESAQAQQDVAATGLIALRNVLALLDERLGEGPYTLGNQFSLCDLYLFVFVLWSRRPVLDGTQIGRSVVEGKSV